MRKLFIIIIIFIFAVPLIGQESRQLSDAEMTELKSIISDSDNAFKEYFMKSRIDYINDKGEADSSSYIGAIKKDASVFMYTDPPVNKGKVFLQRGSEFFMYFPKAKRYLLISSSSKLFGNVAYADIAKWPTLSYYTIEKAYSGKNIKNQKIYKTHFVLKEDAKDLPYYKKVLYVNVDEKRVEMIENYSKSGLLLGVCENLEFKPVNNINFPVKWKITDRNKPKIYSIMTIGDITEAQMDQKLFNPGFLPYAENYLLRESRIK